MWYNKGGICRFWFLASTIAIAMELEVNRADLGSGDYKGNIFVSSNNGIYTIRVKNVILFMG